MTLIKYYSLRCQSCNAAQSTAYESSKKARTEAKKLGWTRVRIDPDSDYDRRRRDLCPKCSS